MSNAIIKEHNGFFGRSLYIYLSILIAIPIYVMINSYVNTIGVREDETVSTAATACFLLGIFSGRYIAQIWTSKMREPPVRLVVILSIIIIAGISWLFFHADFPLIGRVAINLILFWVPFAIISVATGMAIKLVRAVTQNRLREAQAAAATSKSELHVLQSQLSPHFLFNTLNNLYGLSLSQHEKIPPLLLKLSELLRYSVYEATEVYVPLKDEIAYLNNYIDFEKIRIGDRLVLTTDLEDMSGMDIKIAPMLLIVFIENAFKHSKNTADQKIYIEITLKTWGTSVLFSVKNSYSTPKDEAAITNKNSGFGLTSVSKRLELLYQDEYKLEVLKDEGFYQVMLQLKMKK